MKFEPGDLIRNSDTRDLCLILEIKNNTPDSKFLILLIKGLVYKVYLPRWSILWEKI
jgi:hypothetical protein